MRILLLSSSKKVRSPKEKGDRLDDKSRPSRSNGFKYWKRCQAHELIPANFTFMSSRDCDVVTAHWEKIPVPARQSLSWKWQSAECIRYTASNTLYQLDANKSVWRSPVCQASRPLCSQNTLTLSERVFLIPKDPYCVHLFKNYTLKCWKKNFFKKGPLQVLTADFEDREISSTGDWSL